MILVSIFFFFFFKRHLYSLSPSPASEINVPCTLSYDLQVVGLRFRDSKSIFSLEILLRVKIVKREMGNQSQSTVGKLYSLLCMGTPTKIISQEFCESLSLKFLRGLRWNPGKLSSVSVCPW